MTSLSRSRRPLPLDQDPQSSRSTLPGAWLSTWSLSEMTPVNPKYQPDVTELALRKTMTSDHSEDRVSMGSDSADAGFKSARVSVQDDADSTWSADYYSMASDEDMDATLISRESPQGGCKEISLASLKDADVCDASSILNRLEVEESSPISSGSFEVLRPSTHRTTPEECASSDEASGSRCATASEQDASGLPLSGCSIPQNEPCRETRMFLRPPSQIDLASPRTSVVSTSTRDTDFSGQVSSSASAAYGDDDASDHRSENFNDGDDDSDYELSLGPGDSGRTRVDTPSHGTVSNISMASHGCLKPAYGCLPPTASSPRRMESELDFRSLGQPDGSNPWTLGLDPTLASFTGPDSTCASSSRSSTASLSIRSCAAVDVSIDHQDMEHSHPPEMELQSQTSISGALPGTIVSPDSQDTQKQANSYPAILPLEARASTSSSGRPPSTVVQKKSVSQKTKRFYLKVKKLFSPKPNQPISSKGISNDPYRPTNNVDFPAIPDTPPTVSVTPPMPTPPNQWTVYSRTLFGRSRKVSTTQSIAQSFTPGDYSTQPRHYPRSASVVADERYTYEYHARPKTLEEIKADTKRGRRISLPIGIFRGPPSSRPSSAHGSTGAGRSNLGAVPSISSSLHVPQQRWPQVPLTPRSPSLIE